MKQPITKLSHSWLIGLLILAYVFIQSFCIRQLTINYDEGLFAEYGATLLKLQGNKDIVKFDSKLPITALNMLPRAVEQLFHPGLTKPNAIADIIRGRYISLLATITLALLIYHWSALLYGKNAGLFSFLIFLLCPNFLAHGIFVSSDIFGCLFMTASFYFLWKFSKSGQIKNFLFASLSVALAQISKFSMIHLLILFLLLLPVIYFFHRQIVPGQKFSAGKLIGLVFIFAGINWFVICAGHLFYGMFVPLNNYEFRSTVFQNIQQLLHNVGDKLLLPLPSAYIKSMDAVMYFDHLGGGMPGSLNGKSYILGKSSVNGFWYYYFVVMLYKTTLPVLLLLCLTVFLYFKKYSSYSFLRNEMYLILPAVYYLIYLDFFYSTQLGIRHIMIILPLLYIFTGFFIQQINAMPGWYFSCGLIVYQCISVGLYFPHFLPYTNELITDKKMAYKKIADTNLCYGEGGKFLMEYRNRHPEASYLPEKISPGKIVMEVNEMLNLNIATMGKYDWVRGLTPSGHIQSQYLIFEVSRVQADSLRKVHTVRWYK